ncbi:hypothetical protein [Chryseobacterium sp. Hurlbut01]|uniref:hypothetical protein n=1 Tax=Chryseobacterium sp. Hurlbut01 TaxID=1681828 RepID=UPI00067E55B5|nr:hypothetical protein [Chryseobacterium sp. Hurlbut01]KNB62254.1 hypothetical protein AC804_05150 [Chryseobacterium sp. Hurlbut01]
MSENAIKSQSELYDFVEFHDLQNRHSQINFYAYVNIITAESEIKKEEMEVMIYKDVYNRRGKVTLIGNELNPYEFPEEFYPDYQSMKHVNNQYLEIIGNHEQNKKIGNYNVEIYPIRKLKD